MDGFDYLTLALTSYLFALSPGPGVMAILATTIRRGYKSGIAMTVGAVSGDMIYLLLVIISLASLAHDLAGVLFSIRILGALYLLWLGCKTFIAPPLNPDTAKVASKDLAVAFGAGFLISITNPKVIVFYFSLLPQFVDLSSLNLASASKVSAVIYFSVILGPLTVVAFGKQARHLATSPKHAHLVNKVTGILLILVGIMLIATVWI